MSLNAYQRQTLRRRRLRRWLYLKRKKTSLWKPASPTRSSITWSSSSPHLFDERTSPARHRKFVRAILPSARQLGLEGMLDLVNFAALGLIYRQRMQTDEDILVLLDQVRTKPDRWT